MVKSLSTLIRLAKQEVEKEHEIVINLQARRDALHDKWQEIHDKMEDERHLAEANPDLLATFAEYARNAVNQMEKISKDVIKLDERLEVQRERLLEAFAEQKKYELAKENKEKVIAEQEKKQEQKDLDEVASQAHHRKED